MSEQTPKLTPEEFELLAKSPADSPTLLDDGTEPGADAPEGVVEGDDRPSG